MMLNFRSASFGVNELNGKVVVLTVTYRAEMWGNEEG